MEKYVSPNEKIIWQGRKGLAPSLLEAIFTKWLLAYILCLIVVVFLKKTLPVKAIICLCLILVLIAGGYLGFVTVKTINIKYAVTDKGVYAKQGVFVTRVIVKPFNEISHFVIRRGIFDKICGTGDIVIDNGSYRQSLEHSGKLEGFELCNIPDYKKVFGLAKSIQDKTFEALPAKKRK